MVNNNKKIYNSPQNDYLNDYTTPLNSNRFNKSITSRLFPKVVLSG